MQDNLRLHPYDQSIPNHIFVKIWLNTQFRSERLWIKAELFYFEKEIPLPFKNQLDFVEHEKEAVSCDDRNEVKLFT